MSACRKLVLALSALMLLALPALAQQSDPARVALVVGNGRYGQAALAEAAGDARAVAETLRQGRFDVVFSENASRADLEKAIASFSGKLKRGGVAVVFYAGHAVQMRGRNYLVPVDAALRSTQDVSRQALDLDLIVDAVIVSKPRSSVIMLDAAHDNPWQETLSGGKKGLAPFDRMKDVAIASTVAPDRIIGEAAGHAAVIEWLTAIRTPNLDMAAALTRTRDAIAKSPRRNTPLWISSAPPAGLVVTMPEQPVAVAQATRAVIAPGGSPAAPARSDSARVALVVGNAGYRQAALAETAGDARAVAETLRQGRFDVVFSENASRADLEKAIASFSGKLKRGGVAVVFYAGHAVQIRGRNYLVPVDAALRSAQDISRQTLDLDLIIDAMIVSKPRSGVIVLDAARENPWQETLDGSKKGLAAMDRMKDVAIAASAAPDRVVGDAAGHAAVAEWLVAIRTPGLDMAAALTRTRDAIAKSSRRNAPFWISSAPPAGLVVTSTDQPVAVAQATRAVIPPAGPPTQGGQADAYETAFWETIKNSDNPLEYRAYLNAYPTGSFASLARSREQAAREKTNALRAASASATARPPAAANPAAPAGPPNLVNPATPASPAGAAPQSALPSPARPMRDCADCPEIVLLPPGSFEMGSNEMFEFEKPVHAVTLRVPVYIGTREVTFQEWDACVDQGGCMHRPNDRNLGRGRRPVTDIHWDDANAYLTWLSSKTGKRYRLPSESEWEYAARAGTTTSYPWGRSADKEQANCTGCNAQPNRQTIEVGQFPANGFGLYDMAGNAAEWVADCWSETYRSAPRDGSAYTAPGCRERVLRGGSFNNDPRYLRSAARFKYEADVRFYTNGFRVAREP